MKNTIKREQRPSLLGGLPSVSILREAKNYIIVFILLAFSIVACKEEPVGQQPTDDSPPGQVSNVTVESTPGGAIITYSLPTDEDLLYVKAVYSLSNGVQSEVRASLYTDTLKIAGYGDTQDHEVSLIAVDRSRNESVPVKTIITPLEPHVTTIGNTINLVEDFGGIHAYWENPNRAEISVVILQEDNNKEYAPIEIIYSTLVEGEGASRGMDTIPMNFGIYVRDRWENRSEIKYFTLTPLYETKFDRLKFREINGYPGDIPSAWGWVMSNMWDGTVGDQGFHTAQGSGTWPHCFTIDLGVTGKISRVIEFQRQGDWIYAHGNIKKFEVWGCETLDPSGNWDSWTKLMDCTSIKPSGLPLGQKTSEDEAWAAAGEEFVNSPLNPKVRYVRFKVTENWSGGDFLHISELQFFGDDR